MSNYIAPNRVNLPSQGPVFIRLFHRVFESTISAADVDDQFNTWSNERILSTHFFFPDTIVYGTYFIPPPMMQAQVHYIAVFYGQIGDQTQVDPIP